MRWHALDCAVLAIVACFMLRVSPAAADPPRRVVLAVIVGPKSPVVALSLRTLTALYLARPVDDLVALNRPPRSLERIAFDEQVLGKSADAVGRYWVDQEVRGERGAPRAIAEASTLGKLVTKFPSAIGYVRADHVPAGVRVVRIDGKLPGEPGYPLWAAVEP